jgi:hypothetical protein
MATLLTIVLLVHAVIPAAFLWLLWRAHLRAKGEWLLRTLMVGTLAAYLFLAGQWAWLSYYLRYALLGAWAAAAWTAFRRVRRAPWFVPPTLTRAALLLVEGVALGMFGGYFLPRALWGYRHADPPIALSFPLRKGTYYVGNGGTTAVLNPHVRVRSQRYALDIVQLDALGRRASGLYPPDRARYRIYGRTVHAPCTGTVTEAVDGLPDLEPPATDPRHPAGNFVALDCGAATVVLAHLMRGSVQVRTDDSVLVGQPLGRVGNSGNTTEPHLHVHAVRGRPADPVRQGEGVPIAFDQRVLVRNSVVRAR